MASNGSSKTVFLAFSVNFFIAGIKTVIAILTSLVNVFGQGGFVGLVVLVIVCSFFAPNGKK